jgi:hypothetical protein
MPDELPTGLGDEASGRVVAADRLEVLPSQDVGSREIGVGRRVEARGQEPA